MATDELTPEEIIALLRMAKFPPGAIPVGGYPNALEFSTRFPDPARTAGLPWVRADQEARVRAFRPDIVHFFCHGDSDRLAFNDPRGEYDLVKASRIADTLAYYRESAGGRLRAIVLAACDGNTLAPYFTGVADTVIGHDG